MPAASFTLLENMKIWCKIYNISIHITFSNYTKLYGVLYNLFIEASQQSFCLSEIDISIKDFYNIPMSTNTISQQFKVLKVQDNKICIYFISIFLSLYPCQFFSFSKCAMLARGVLQTRSREVDSQCAVLASVVSSNFFYSYRGIFLFFKAHLHLCLCNIVVKQAIRYLCPFYYYYF